MGSPLRAGAAGITEGYTRGERWRTRGCGPSRTACHTHTHTIAIPFRTDEPSRTALDRPCTTQHIHTNSRRTNCLHRRARNLEIKIPCFVTMLDARQGAGGRTTCWRWTDGACEKMRGGGPGVKFSPCEAGFLGPRPPAADPGHKPEHADCRWQPRRDVTQRTTHTTLEPGTGKDTHVRGLPPLQTRASPSSALRDHVSPCDVPDSSAVAANTLLVGGGRKEVRRPAHLGYWACHRPGKQRHRLLQRPHLGRRSPPEGPFSAESSWGFLE